MRAESKLVRHGRRRGGGLATLDPGLASFAAAAVGPVVAATGCSQPHGRAVVCRLDTPRGRFFLKSHPNERQHRQELHAYRTWLPQPPDLTPTLVAERASAPRALLLTAVPGRVVDGLRLDAGREREVYRRAGRFLGALHRLPHVDADPLRLEGALLRRFEDAAARAGGRVDAATVRWVEARVDEAAASLGGARRVPCHRDFSPRNWLVSSRGVGALAVIDFEHSRPDLALDDLERLWSLVWWGRRDLEEAFFEGYGRRLTHGERELLWRLSALRALATVGWACARGDTAVEAFGRRTLERLRAR